MKDDRPAYKIRVGLYDPVIAVYSIQIYKTEFVKQTSNSTGV